MQKYIKSSKKRKKVLKNALFFHFYVYYDIFWRLDVVSLHPISKITIFV